MKQQPKWQPGDVIKASDLSAMAKWLWNMVGENGVDVSYDENQIVFSIAPDVLSKAALDYLSHPFKIWVRNTGIALQYAVNEGFPGIGDTFSGAHAGDVILPSGVAQNVTAVGWTAISSSASVYLHFSVSTGAITTSISTTPGTNSPNASPALFDVPLGRVEVSGESIIAFGEQFSNVSLVGAMIAAWYAAYDATKYQQFYHAPNAAPSWVTVYDCADGEEYAG